MWESEVDRLRRLQAARLREARKMRGFKSARAAQLRFGWSSAYGSHENGTRGIGRMYRDYARKFRVNPAWLLGHSDERDAVVRGIKVMADAAIGTWHEGQDRPERPGRMSNVGVPTQENSIEEQFAIFVADASMNKKMPQGSYAICTPVEDGETFAIGDFVYVERIRNGMMELSLRRVSAITPAGSLKLTAFSVDPKFKQELTFPVTNKDRNSESLRIIGLVVAYQIPLRRPE